MRSPPDLSAVDVWVFDLDNTLYPARCNLFAQVSQRMGAFISEFLAVELDEARAVQKDYFRRHGTTLRGLMVEHDMDPTPFLDYVHDIDLSPVPRDDRLDRALTALPGRKVIFTNGTISHARRITDHLGVSHHFEAVYDIAEAGYVPKPEPGPYQDLAERHDIEPASAVMIEDMARNLVPAAEMGMTTVWVRGDSEWSRAGHQGEHVHHVTDDLIDWLVEITDEPVSSRG